MTLDSFCAFNEPLLDTVFAAGSFLDDVLFFVDTLLFVKSFFLAEMFDFVAFFFFIVSFFFCDSFLFVVCFFADSDLTLLTLRPRGALEELVSFLLDLASLGLLGDESDVGDGVDLRVLFSFLEPDFEDCGAATLIEVSRAFDLTFPPPFILSLHFVHFPLIRLCSHIEPPPHSTHTDLIRLCTHIDPPLQSLH